MELELLTLPEDLSSHPILSGVGVTRSLVLCVCFVDRCLSFCPLCCLSFDLLILITPLVYSNSIYPSAQQELNPSFSGARIPQSSDFCIMFIYHGMFCCPFPF